MEVLREIAPNKNIALALGYFDGIHIAHKKLITLLVQQSKQRGIKSAVVTFDKNPVNYFNQKKTPNIQTFKDRELLLESLGVDYLYELDFEQYKDLSAQVYLKDVLIKNFEPQLIIVGYNHTFGKNKSANAQTLKEYSSKYNYECTIMLEQKYKENEKISSTEIRKKIETGDLEGAKELLGRSFSIRNSVIKGDGIAAKLGYPTANIIWSDSLVKLPYGVYFGKVQLDSGLLPALISWGVKPTLSSGKNEVLEAHIYNFSGNLYGKIINVVFDKKLRDQENFGNILVLKTQLQKDYRQFEKWVKLNF